MFPQSIPRRPFVGLFVIVLAVVGMALAFRSWRSSERATSSPLPRLGVVPEFSLIDQEARPFGLKDLQGKVWVANFIAIRSSGPDPILSSRFAELDSDFRKDERLRLISFTVDPQNDTPEALRDYARRFEASVRWSFLTGNKQKIDELVRTGFQLAEHDSRSLSRDGIQSTNFILVDANGTIRGYYDGTSNETVQRILTDVGSLLRDRER
jgi:protein SCO1/2